MISAEKFLWRLVDGRANELSPSSGRRPTARQLSVASLATAWRPSSAEFGASPPRLLVRPAVTSDLDGNTLVAAMRSSAYEGQEDYSRQMPISGSIAHPARQLAAMSTKSLATDCRAASAVKSSAESCALGVRLSACGSFAAAVPACETITSLSASAATGPFGRTKSPQCWRCSKPLTTLD